MTEKQNPVAIIRDDAGIDECSTHMNMKSTFLSHAGSPAN